MWFGLTASEMCTGYWGGGRNVRTRCPNVTEYVFCDSGEPSLVNCIVLVVQTRAKCCQEHSVIKVRAHTGCSSGWDRWTGNVQVISLAHLSLTHAHTDTHTHLNLQTVIFLKWDQLNVTAELRAAGLLADVELLVETPRQRTTFSVVT